jgi:hypothetical protein
MSILIGKAIFKIRQVIEEFRNNKRIFLHGAKRGLL